MSLSTVNITNRAALVLWLLGGSVACRLAFITVDASYLNGVFYPVGMDSFYHARRVFDVYDGLLTNFHFDSLVYAPEGTWITWPWLYDTILAYLAKAVNMIGVSSKEYAAFALPPIWIYANFALCVLIMLVCRVNLLIAVSVVLCLTFSPLLQNLHSFARIDHHFAELTMILAITISGVLWLRNINKNAYALLSGGIFGIAPTIHNGAFIFYLPFVFTFFLVWVSGRMNVNIRTAIVFSAGMITVMFALLLNSPPFLEGFFQYYYFSWFHLYFAIVCGSVVIFMSRYEATSRTILLLLTTMILTSAPLITNVLHGYAWLDSEIPYFTNIEEFKSPFTWGEPIIPQLFNLSNYLGTFLIALPIVVTLTLFFIARGSDYYVVYIGLVFVLSQVLWLHQQRFAYFSVPMLVLFTGVAIDTFLKTEISDTATRKLLNWTVSAVMIATPFLTYGAFTKIRPALGVPDYPLVLPMVTKLGQLCEDNPGIVLTDSHFGHLVRYLTNCSVLSNNMFNTEQHYRKALETQEFHRKKPIEIAKTQPMIKYILVVNAKFAVAKEKSNDTESYPLTTLLLNEDSRGNIPSIENVLLLKLNRNGTEEIYGGLFKLVEKDV